VPLLFTAGSAAAQMPYDEGTGQNPIYMSRDAGPTRIVQRRVPPNYVEADGPNALYPVKSYVIERQPIVVPAPNVTVNNTIVMQRPAPRPVRKHVYKRPCQCKL
jgi:hypothetical protein